MLSYGGISLTECTPELAAWISQDIDPNYSRGILRRDADRNHLDYSCLPGLGNSPPIRVGTLRYPAWGASNWAEGLFIADDEAMTQIRALAYQNNTLNALNLEISDGENSLSIPLFMLPPRQLVDCGLPAKPLWLISLVDARFYWWYRSGTVSVTQGTTTWAQLFASLALALDITLTVDTVDSAYLKPPGGIHWSGRPLPVLLDAAAASVGMRLVRTLDGTCRVMSADTSISKHAQNLELADTFAGGHLLLGPPPGGDDHNANIPASVTVVFDKDDASAPYQVEVDITDIDGESLFGYRRGFSGTKRIRSTAVAGLGNPPANETELDALALQIATDYYKHRLARSEARYELIVPWDMEGLSGLVEFEHTTDRISTRVCRPAELEHTDVLYHLASSVYDDRLVTFGHGSRIHAGSLTIAERLDCGYVDAGSISTNQTALEPPDAPVLLITAGADIDISGFDAPDPLRGQTFVLFNKSEEFTAALKHEDSSASAVDRLLCPGLGDLAVVPLGGVLIYYDLTVNRWRPVCCGSGGGGGSGTINNFYVEETWLTDVHDYEPPDGYSVILISSGSPINWTGVELDEGQELTFINIGEHPIAIPVDSPMSNPPNTFDLPADATTIILNPGDTVFVVNNPESNTNFVISTTAPIVPAIPTIPITGTTNNLEIGTSSELTTLVLTGDQTLTGIEGGVPGQILTITVDPSSTGTLTLEHDSPGSSEGNTFDLPGDFDYTIQPSSTFTLIYQGDYETGSWTILDTGLYIPQVPATPLSGIYNDFSIFEIASGLVTVMDGATTITGLVVGDGNEGEETSLFVITNPSTNTDNLTIAHEDGGSSIGNQFSISTGEDLVLSPGESAAFSYDGTYFLDTPSLASLTSADEKVKVSANDTTAGYLNGKLVAGSNITLTENSDGGNETLTIAATGGASLTSGTAALGSPYTVTTSYASTGLSVSLPSSGTYLLLCNVLSYIDGSQHEKSIFRLYNSSDAAAVGPVGIHELAATTAAQAQGCSVTLHAIVTVAASKTIQLQAITDTTGTSEVAATETTLSYVKIA